MDIHLRSMEPERPQLSQPILLNTRADWLCCQLTVSQFPLTVKQFPNSLFIPFYSCPTSLFSLYFYLVNDREGRWVLLQRKQPTHPSTVFCLMDFDPTFTSSSALMGGCRLNQTGSTRSMCCCSVTKSGVICLQESIKNSDVHVRHFSCNKKLIEERERKARSCFPHRPSAPSPPATYVFHQLHPGACPLALCSRTFQEEHDTQLQWHSVYSGLWLLFKRVYMNVALFRISTLHKQLSLNHLSHTLNH